MKMQESCDAKLVATFGNAELRRLDAPTGVAAVPTFESWTTMKYWK